MAKSSFDFKDFALKYGERVGLGVGLALMLGLSVWGLMSSAPTDVSADLIKNNAKNAEQAIASNPVVVEKLEPDGIIKPERIQSLLVSVQQFIAPGSLNCMLPFAIYLPNEDHFRVNPNIYTPTQLVAGPVLIGIRTIEVRGENGESVLISVPQPGIKSNKENAAKGQDKLKDRGKKGYPGAGGPGGPPGGPGSGGPGAGGGKGGAGAGAGAGLPGAPGAGAGGNQSAGPAPQDDTKYRAEWKLWKDVQDKDVLAENLWPAQATLVLGSFPYKSQIQEFAKALKIAEMEVTLPIDSLEVQRREIIARGSRMRDGMLLDQDMVRMPDGTTKYLAQIPATLGPEDGSQGGWVTLDARKFRVIKLVVPDWEEESDPIVKGLQELSDRLVMKLPKAVHGKYTQAELIKNLDQVQATIQKYKDLNESMVPPPRRDRRMPADDFDPFGGGTQSGGAGADMPNRAGGTGGTGGLKIDDNLRGGDKKQPGAPGADAGSFQKSAMTPDSCLVRFLDLDLDANTTSGKTYEYRVRVVMRNPNWGEDQMVADPELARIKELKSNWTTSIPRVTFPDADYVFVDERIRDKKSSMDTDRDKVPLQVHRWLGRIFNRVALTTMTEERVAEWWVDRLLAGKGEYIGRVPFHNELQMCVWNSVVPNTEDKGRLGIDTIHKVKTDGLTTLNLLVDFEGGFKQMRSFGNRRWEEDTPAEVLIVQSDGRMIARSLLHDASEKERKDRYDRWEKWYETVKNRKEKDKTDGMDKKKDDKLFDK